MPNPYRFIPTTLAVVFLAGALCAAENPVPAPVDEGVRPPADTVGERPRKREGADKQARRPTGMRVMEDLKRNNPAKYRELQRLRTEDPDAFAAELRTLFKARNAGVTTDRQQPEKGPRGSAEERRCHELSRLYAEARTDEEREALRAELAEAVEAAFEQKISGTKERIEKLETSLKHFRESVEQMEANRADLCKARLEELTRPREDDGPAEPAEP